MVISYHNACPHCAKVNKVDITLDEYCNGRGLVTCHDCGRMYVFIVLVKKVEE